MSRMIIAIAMKFTIPPHSDSSWIKFLRTLLPPAESRVISTHGDFRAANILVEVDESGRYFIRRIIDWETGGIYPEYLESSTVLYLNAEFETDWWRYIPVCIVPVTNLGRWLVGRLWDQYVNSS
ncbi:kinase-like domain protein [Rutstroemia sp. NJR-2017a WRK4]|nr:kinase-like domain protein [Rutstroemia sp. NJR-2017a WRK4]